MLPGADYCDFLALANRSFGDTKPTIGVGFLFAPLGSPYVRDAIVPRLGQWHLATKRDLIVACSGYTSDLQHLEGRGIQDAREVDYHDPATNQKWYYSDLVFQAFVDAVRNVVPGWQYRGEVDLLLAPWGLPLSGRDLDQVQMLTAPYSDVPPLRGPDFSQAVEVKLTEIIAAGSVYSATTFIYDLLNSGMSIHTFTRVNQGRSWAHALAETLHSLLPVNLQPLIDRTSIVRPIT